MHALPSEPWRPTPDSTSEASVGWVHQVKVGVSLHSQSFYGQRCINESRAQMWVTRERELSCVRLESDRYFAKPEQPQLQNAEAKVGFLGAGKEEHVSTWKRNA